MRGGRISRPAAGAAPVTSSIGPRRSSPISSDRNSASAGDLARGAGAGARRGNVRSLHVNAQRQEDFLSFLISHLTTAVTSSLFCCRGTFHVRMPSGATFIPSGPATSS